ncbi:MBL fold metallo-hydrolase [uncultured Selenomonas sp.]|uniref:MBL fold metallo-hydrolase n=1 Tax=uncultured Selenomonas sp. TaxID=159275 RepID=UPI0025ED7DAF|nr:MBL fold metallo-hydrolase [uncultured Selenomonas sp.]
MRHRVAPIAFMALGGGQTIGNSCYALGLGGLCGTQVLLDCGASRRGGGWMEPAFSAWHAAVQSAGRTAEAAQLFVSHAHLDHARLVPQLAEQHPAMDVYMTEVTRAFLAMQSGGPPLRAQTVSYGQRLRFDDYEASFWPAGHIAGAMMTLLSFGGRKILYTGDYSCLSTPWAEACALPDVPIDVLILCAVHAVHPHHGMPVGLRGLYRAMREAIGDGQSVYARCRQLSKGSELLRYLRSSDVLRDVPIYLDPRMMATVEALEALGIPVLSAHDYPLAAWQGQQPCIVLGTKEASGRFASFVHVEGDQFSLHDDFEQTAAFIRRVAPKLAVIVHCVPSAQETVASVLEREADCRTQFLFPVDGELYEL